MIEFQKTRRKMVLAFLLIAGALTFGHHLLAQEAKKPGEIRGKITVSRVDAEPPKTPIIDRYSTHRPGVVRVYCDIHS